MVGWHLLLLLAAEIVIYGAVARHMHVDHGWGLPASILLPFGIYVGVRAVLIAAEFLLARSKVSPVPAELHVQPLELIEMYLRELAGWVLMFGIVMPFVASRRSVIDRKTHSSDQLPILLVHGLACNRGNWILFRRRLERRGLRAYALDCTPPFSHVAGYASQLARAVDEVLVAEKSSRLVLIGHSMGGLISRAYLDQFGDQKIAHVITLGTPHLGTWLAKLAVGPNVRDMRLDSRWLAELRERESARSSNPYGNFTCVYSLHDNLVTPQLNAALQGARYIRLAGVGHLSLVLSSRVFEHVFAILRTLRGSA